VLWRQGADLVVVCNCDIQVLANQAVALQGKRSHGETGTLRFLSIVL